MSNQSNGPIAGWRGRRVPLIIFGSLVLVIFLSTLLFRSALLGHIDLPKLLGTNNKGVLIHPPRAIDQLPLQTAGGEKFDYAKLPPQWSIVIPAPQSCDSVCQQNLYITRQIHIALGKEADRVRRFALTTGPIDADFEKLLEQHPKLQVLTADPAAFEEFFATALKLQPLRDGLYFVVDPQGWVMMYYTPKHDGKAVLADLKFLLKNSHEQEGKN